MNKKNISDIHDNNSDDDNDNGDYLTYCKIITITVTIIIINTKIKKMNIKNTILISIRENLAKGSCTANVIQANIAIVACAGQ